jgi:hypothetical protein
MQTNVLLGETVDQMETERALASSLRSVLRYRHICVMYCGYHHRVECGVRAVSGSERAGGMDI